MTFRGTGEPFSALYEAQRWLSERGYSYAPLCGYEPVGILKGAAQIAKWRNLSATERILLDGKLTSTNFRDGPVHLHLIEYTGEARHA